MTVPTVAFDVSTIGETPVTVRLSATVLNSILKSTRAVCCTCSSRSTVEGRKPSSSLFTEYGPGGSAGRSNSPTSLLTVVRVALVDVFTTVMVTPGRTAPVESFTVPVMVPRVCAKTGAHSSNPVKPASSVRRIGQAPSDRGRGLVAVIADRRCDSCCDQDPTARQKKEPLRRNENAVAKRVTAVKTRRAYA